MSALRAPADAFRGLRQLASGKDEVDLERFLVALVRSVRADVAAEELTSRDVYKAARRRRRRLGLLSFATGPLVGLADQLVDLYCDTATVCDLDALHRLGLTDAQVAAHMLVLWALTDDVEAAHAAIQGRDDGGVSALVSARFRAFAEAQLPKDFGVRRSVRVLWQARQLVEDTRRSVVAKPVEKVLRPGRAAKDVIARAELQLGV